MDALLTLQGVHTRIAGSHILQGVTFDATRAQTTVLLGRNGAGKSTTLRTILGLWSPDRGSIMLDGRELTSRPPHRIAREGIGFVPEDREVFAALTVEENLRLAQRRASRRVSNSASGKDSRATPTSNVSNGTSNGSQDGRPPSESGESISERPLTAGDRVSSPPNTSQSSGSTPVERIYAMFPDLRAARGRSAGALSGGQQQMLAIGRALVNNNKILLVDEPTKGLAPVIVQQLAQTFRSLREQGQTILLVEQNLEFARAVADRYFIVDEGRIVRGGEMAELAEQPELLRRYIGV